MTTFIIKRAVLPALLGLLILSSCELSRAAMDFSDDQFKNKETGNSSYPTDLLNGINLMLFGTFRMTDPNLASSMTPDFPYVAAVAKDPYANGLFLGGGPEVVGKGTKYAQGKTRLTYLELPVYAMYQYGVGEKGVLMGGVGPYFAYGLGGKTAGQPSFGDGANDAGYKRFDAGLSLRVGYELKMGLSLSVNYDYGLANTAYAGQDIKGYNRGFGIHLAYDLGQYFLPSRK